MPTALSDWLALARPLNPDLDDDKLSSYWAEHHGDAYLTSTPTPEKESWVARAKSLNPARSQPYLEHWYTEKYPDAVAPAAPDPEAPDPDDDFMRTMGNYVPQTQEALGAGTMLAGEAIRRNVSETGGSWLSEKGKEWMEAGGKEVQSKPTDEFLYSLEHGRILDSYLPHLAGSAVGNLMEALAVSGVGAVIGGMAGGGANPVTAAAGGVVGLVARGSLKHELVAEAKRLAIDLGEEKAQEFLRRELAKNAGRNVALGSAALLHGYGETGRSVVQELEAQGKGLDEADLGTWGMTGLAHAGAEMLGDTIALGAVSRYADRAPAAGLLGAITGATTAGVATGLKEMPVEVFQTGMERLAGGKDLTGPDAMRDYINAGVAGFGQGGMVGGAGSVGRSVFGDTREARAERDLTLEGFLQAPPVQTPEATKAAVMGAGSTSEAMALAAESVRLKQSPEADAITSATLGEHAETQNLASAVFNKHLKPGEFTISIEGALAALEGREPVLDAGELSRAGLKVDVPQDARQGRYTAFADSDPVTRATDDADTFYSKLEQGVRDFKQEAMPAAQWSLWLRSNGGKLGIKKEEIAATGLGEFLQAKGNAKVGKQEILDHLDDNAVAITEEVEGDSAVRWEVDEEGTHRPVIVSSDENSDLQYIPEELGTITKSSTGWEVRRPTGSRGTEVATVASLDAAKREVEKDLQQGGHLLGSARYSQYQESGSAGPAPHRILKLKPDDGSDFRDAAHWGRENNINTTIRVTDRVTADGKKIAHVEEIQDFKANEYRKSGSTSRAAGEIAQRRSAVETEIKNLSNQQRDEMLAAKETATEGEYREQFNAIRARYSEKLEALDDELEALKHERGLPYDSPKNPYFKDTQLWTGLAQRKVLRWAAENGYDGVTWTPGEVQANRFGERQLVDRAALIHDNRSGELTLTLGKKGQPKQVKDTAEIEKLLGPEDASRLIEAMRSSKLDGLGRFKRGVIKVEPRAMGGEWAYDYYDKVVPGAASKAIAPHGGQIEEIDLQGIGKRLGYWIPEKTRAEVRSRGVPVMADQVVPTPEQKAKGYSPIGPKIASTAKYGEKMEPHDSPLTVALKRTPDGKLAVKWLDEDPPAEYLSLTRGKNPHVALPKTTRELRPYEAEVIAKALHSFAAAGHDIREVIQHTDSWYAHNGTSQDGGALYSGEARAQVISADILRAAYEGHEGARDVILRYISHESTHDIDIGNRTIDEALSTQSGLFDFEITSTLANGQIRLDRVGAIMAEAVTAWSTNRGELGQYLDYPFHKLAAIVDGNTADVAVVKTEVFAQLGSLYLVRPDLMQEHLPKAHALFKRIFNAAKSPAGKSSAGERDARVRETLRASGASDQSIFVRTARDRGSPRQGQADTAVREAQRGEVWGGKYTQTTKRLSPSEVKSISGRIATTLAELRSRIAARFRVATPSPKGDGTPGSTARKHADGKPYSDRDLTKSTSKHEILRGAARAAWAVGVSRSKQASQDTVASLRSKLLAKGTAAFDAAFWERALSLPDRARYWYEVSAEMFREKFPDLSPHEMRIFIALVAATSASANPYQNLARAIGAFSQYLRGEPIDVDLIDAGPARDALYEGDLEGLKTGSFGGTMHYILGLGDEVPLSTNDRQVAALFGLGPNDIGSHPELYEPISRFFINLRNHLNKQLPEGADKWETWQLQAIAWVQLRIDKRPEEKNDDYGQAMVNVHDEFAEKGMFQRIREKGIELKGDVVRREDFIKQDIAAAMSPSMEPFLEAHVATVEVLTVIDQEQARIEELVAAAKEAHPKAYERYRNAIIGGIRELRGKKVFTPLIKAVMGVYGGQIPDKWAGTTRTHVPQTNDPFSVGGTWEGTFGFNMRLPLPNWLAGEERAVVNAVVGMGLTQAGMGAASLKPASFTNPPAPGTRRVFGVFIETSKSDIGQQPDAVTRYERRFFNPQSQSHEAFTTVRRVANGYVVTAIPSGERGLTLRQVTEAAAAVFVGQRIAIMPYDLKSDYGIDFIEHDTGIANPVKDAAKGEKKIAMTGNEWTRLFTAAGLKKRDLERAGVADMLAAKPDKPVTREALIKAADSPVGSIPARQAAKNKSRNMALSGYKALVGRFYHDLLAYHTDKIEEILAHGKKDKAGNWVNQLGISRVDIHAYLEGTGRLTPRAPTDRLPGRAAIGKIARQYARRLDHLDTGIFRAVDGGFGILARQREWQQAERAGIEKAQGKAQARQPAARIAAADAVPVAGGMSVAEAEAAAIRYLGKATYRRHAAAGLTFVETLADVPAAAIPDGYAARAIGNPKHPNTPLVPETDEFAASTTGDLAIMPTAPGIRPLPIRMGVGKQFGQLHTGFGMEHAETIVKDSPKRAPPARTGDLQEDILRNVLAALRRKKVQIHRELDGKIVVTTGKGELGVILTLETGAKPHYSVVTYSLPVKGEWNGLPLWTGTLARSHEDVRRPHAANPALRGPALASSAVAGPEVLAESSDRTKDSTALDRGQVLRDGDAIYWERDGELVLHGLHDPASGKTYVIARNIREGLLEPTLVHELVHARVTAEMGGRTFFRVLTGKTGEALTARLEMLRKNGNQATKDILAAVDAHVARTGETEQDRIDEEVMAYLVGIYAVDDTVFPAGVRQLVESVIRAVRDGIRRFAVKAGLNPERTIATMSLGEIARLMRSAATSSPHPAIGDTITLGARTLQVPLAMRGNPRVRSLADPHPSPAVEAIDRRAHGEMSGRNLTFRQRQARRLEAAAATMHKLTRTFEHLDPKDKSLAPAYNILRKFRAALDNAGQTVLEQLHGVLDYLQNEAEYDLFEEAVFLADLMHDATAQYDARTGAMIRGPLDLPNSYTPALLRMRMVQVNVAVAAHPNVQAALQARQELHDQIRADLVSYGLATDASLTNTSYFRHMVLEYAAVHGMNISNDETLDKAKPKYLMHRRGTKLTINTNFLEVEYGFLRAVERDLTVAKTIFALRGAYDKSAAFKAWRDAEVAAQKRAYDKQGVPDYRRRERFPSLNEALREYKALNPELADFSLHQFDTGKHFFLQNSITDGAFNRFLDMTSSALTGIKGVTQAEVAKIMKGIRPALIKAPNEFPALLPTAIVKQLKELSPVEANTFANMMIERPVKLWKGYILMNPKSIVGYTINNTIGDVDALIAGAAAAMSLVPQAMREVFGVAYGRLARSTDYLDAVERGVFDAGWTQTEAAKMGTLEDFYALTGEAPNGAVRAVQWYWDRARKFSVTRESVARYAAYLYYMQEFRRQQSLTPALSESEVVSKVLDRIGYGASYRPMIDGLLDTNSWRGTAAYEDIAAMMSRDLIGDYGAISHWGQNLRNTLIPFWSFMEINLRRYKRLIENAFADRGGNRAGLAIIAFAKMGFMYSLLHVTNAMILALNGDDPEEEELPIIDRVRLHLNFGKDSNGDYTMMRMQGSLSDFLSWVGFGDALSLMRQLESGMIGWEDVLTTIAYAPGDKLWGSLNPVPKTAIELAFGVTAYPSLQHPRAIRDGWKHLWKTVKLDAEYEALAGKPSKGYAASWLGALALKKVDPGEQNYYAFQSVKKAYQSKFQGWEGGSDFSTPQSEALRNYKLAVRYRDTAAIDKYSKMMDELGVTGQSRLRAIRNAHPLANIQQAHRAQFISLLTPLEQKMLDHATDWWEKVFLE